MKCDCCGVDKDPTQLELYPYPDDCLCDDEPIEPLLQIECSSPTVSKLCVVCHCCFHRILPDMWIDRKWWESLNPTTPFESLPPFTGYHPLAPESPLK